MAKTEKQTNDYIRCCPRCGNPKLEWMGGDEETVFDAIGFDTIDRTSLSGMMYCTRCKRKVPPIEFDSEKNYLRFVKTLRKNIGKAKTKSKKSK